MSQQVYKNIISLTSLAILIAIVFSCQIGLWNSIFTASLAHIHYKVEPIADYCQTGDNQKNNS